MKNAKHVVVVLTILFLSFSTAVAQHSQDLEWGVSVDDRFDFTYEYSQPSTDSEGTEDFYITISMEKTIPDPAEFFTDVILTSEIDFWWANGTPVQTSIPMTIIAIGNWELVTNLYATQTGTPDVVTETSSEWIITIENTHTGGSQISETRVSKADGVMNYYSFSYTQDGEVLSSVEITRAGYSPPLLGDLDPILLFIGVGAVAAVVILVVLMKKRG